VKITAISAQVKNKDRVNIMVDGAYRFSLDIFQVGELGIRVGKDYTDEELTELEVESQFGKLYGRALEYTMMRPHSAKEVRDYLWRKTRTMRVRIPDTNDYKEKPGVSQELTGRVYDRLVEKGYIDDEKFARFWVENRNLTKGSSKRKLVAELRTKGIDTVIINQYLEESERSDESELAKIIAKKRPRYPDEQKFIQYLARQGFSYEDIKRGLAGE